MADKPTVSLQDGTLMPSKFLDDNSIKTSQKCSVVIIANGSFLRRLWILISNPFRYLFVGKIIY